MKSVYTVNTPEEMEKFGGALAQYLQAYSPAAAVIYLRGDLGAGKTTLVRGTLRALGYVGLVKSPTFTLVETYSITPHDIYHFDLYRISDPEELEYIGLREFCGQHSLCFIEWPDQGKSMVPEPTVELWIEYCDQGRRVTSSVPL